MTYNKLACGVRRALLVSVLGSAAIAAQAQEAPQNKGDAVTLDRIVVTAQSREQELQDVPIALNVLDESLLRDVLGAGVQLADCTLRYGAPAAGPARVHG